MEQKLGIKKLVFIYLFTLCLVGVDQLTKYLAASLIERGHRNTLIPGFFYFTYCENTGAAWSIFTGKTILLALVSLLAAAVICFILHHSTTMPLAFSLGLILAGAIGNMIDRFARGYVIDFLDFDIFRYNFPVFNFADMCVVIGCFLLAFVVIFTKNKKLLVRPSFMRRKSEDGGND